jgi:hypothetical protein
VRARVAGVWQDIESVSAKVGGAWKNVIKGWARVAGVWRVIFEPKGNYELIASVTLATAGNVTFSSIPQTFKHLELHISGRKNGSSVTTDRFRVNGISTSSYYWSGMYGNQQDNPTDTTIATSAGSLSFIPIGFLNTNADTEQFSQSRVIVNDYTSDKLKQFYSTASMTTGATIASAFSGMVNTTDPVTQLFMFVSDTYAAGSKFDLYGVSA